jgi:uncharacterized membrane protein
MNGTIVLTVLLMVGSGELKRAVTKENTSVFHPILAGFIVGIFLFILAAFNGPFAQKACYVLIAFALIANGAGIASAVGTGAARPGTRTTPQPGGGVLKNSAIPGFNTPI